MRKKPQFILMLFLATLLSGCGHFGPSILPENRTNYNASLHKSNSEQLLLNIVRLRYSDPAFFLSVNNIASSFSISASASPSLSFSNSSDSRSLGANISHSERPVISYRPLQDEAFTKRLLRPIPLESLLLFHNSGWELERIFRLFINRIGGLYNAKGFSSPEMIVPPKYKEFIQLSDGLEILEFHGIIGFRAKLKKNKKAPLQITIPFTGKAIDRDIYNEFLREFNISTKFNEVILVSSPKKVLPKNYLSVQTRSVIDILNFLAKGVDVPQKDLDNGLVINPKGQDGKPFNWKDVTKNLINIQYSSSIPLNAAVKVRYRDNWFYIADNSIQSKRTFATLLQLFDLQAGDVNENSPIYAFGL